ncbi:cation diffusion facilitator family transporter [Azospirillum sp. sgz301742]
MQESKESVALSSVFASAFMAAMKLVVGLMTGSLAILSEAAHSLLDLGAAALTWFAVRMSDQPADENHPYGHGKVESISALIETGLLFVTGAWIVKEAVERLLSDTVAVETPWYAVAVIVVSIAIDFGRSRALYRVAKETGSQALEADALHFSSDIVSSAVVLLGLGFVALGWPKGDAVAALGVAVFVALAGWRLGKRTIDVLMDAAPEGVTDRVTRIAAKVPDVARVERVRVRPAGNVLFLDVELRVSRTLPFERVAALRAEVADAIRAALPEADPLVVAEPLALDDESIAETVRVKAAARGLAVHDVSVQDVAGRKHLGFDLEVEEDLSIGAAHDIATELEQALLAELGDIAIDSHIDPRRTHVVQGRDLDPDRLAALTADIEAIGRDLPTIKGVHHVRVQQVEEGLYVSFHCVFAGDAPVRRVHDATARFEYLIRDRLRGIARVVVHAEPVGHHDDPVTGVSTVPAE